MLKIYRKRLDWDGKAKLIMLIVKPFNVLREEIIQSGMVERMTMLKKKRILSTQLSQIRSELVYSSLLQTGEIVESTFEATASESL